LEVAEKGFFFHAGLRLPFLQRVSGFLETISATSNPPTKAIFELGFRERKRVQAKHNRSAVRGVEIEGFHMAVGVVDPVGEREIADDSDLKMPSGVVKVRCISHCERVTTDGGNRIAEVFSSF
jgi:hypothetical protein